MSLFVYDISFADTVACPYVDGDGKTRVTQAANAANCEEVKAAFSKVKTGSKDGFGAAGPKLISMEQKPPDMHAAIGSHVDTLFKASQLKDLEAQYNDLAGGKNLLKECWSSRDSADSGCLENQSVKIQSGAALIGPILGSIQMGAGTSLACSKWGEALKVVQVALSAYNAECGFMKGRCDTRCKDASERMANFGTSVERLCQSETAKKLFDPTSGAALNKSGVTVAQYEASCVEVRGYVKAQLVAGSKGSVANNFNTCKSYAQQYMAGFTGLMGAITSNMSARKCQDESGVKTADCSATPNAPECVKEKTCDDPSRSNSPECICEKNPRAPGCGASVSTAGSSNYGTPTESSSRTRGAIANLPKGTSGDSGAPGEPPKGGASPSGMGGGSGSGSGSLGGSGGSTQNAKGDKATIAGAGSKVGDGGFSEGGGGGRGLKFSAYKGDSSLSKNPLNKFMPKTEGMIGAYQPGSDPSVEISGPHGKDLFDKVSDRYREIGPQMSP